ncbi:MAG TPA: DivIVA domain-containing protein [Candidatus Limnocylindria bacterium]|nr:DivIVA domain-containing protein [Candidatus Limnocylindria bacterium]
MPLSASDVANKQFTTVKLREGYNMEEVDGFLDEVEAELGRLHREIDDLTAKAAAAPVAPPVVAAPVAPEAPVAAAAPAAPPASDSAVQMLALAQKTADEHLAAAKVEANRIVGEAQATHDRTMGDLASERVAVQAKVDELRAFEKEYRTRLRSYLEGQLRDLEAKSAAPATLGTVTAPLVAHPPAATPSAPSASGVAEASSPAAAPAAQEPPTQQAAPAVAPSVAPSVAPAAAPQPPRPFSPAPAPEAPSGPPTQAD